MWTGNGPSLGEYTGEAAKVFRECVRTVKPSGSMVNNITGAQTGAAPAPQKACQRH